MKIIESHPGIPLIDHLTEVAKNCLIIAHRNNTNFGLEEKIKAGLLFICGFYHDLGKATSYFQNYLLNPEGQHNSLKNHALPSAVFVLYVAKEYLKEKELTKDERFLLITICFIVVRRHHGNLGNFKNELGIDHFKEDLDKQFKSIDKQAIQEIIEIGNEKLKISVDWSDFINWFENDGSRKETRLELIAFYNLNFQKKMGKSQKIRSLLSFLMDVWSFIVLR